ncbi:GNAT family N-acetyltransferase [Nocardiopsis metallicus]|uniref:Ribosomal protein S18 acetylase RimI-like enzyme n=1 Tax=Nocardiopsis metallicus TaxID=179819 RepID=A0A840WGR6_9ACTN|nr:GNAT family N-acetyltransferase [Nocardiopsis metallicus]MBB5490596.1 ribosomal protein S18 acetylase RimI-like enzyme [Nocardiopsis metallicus]
MREEIRLRFPVDDGELSRLHADAFSHEVALVPWGERLERHSRSWAGSFVRGRLVGFVHAVWDGGKHAFVLDTAVASDMRRRGVGGRVVAALLEDLRGLGIEWVHVDYEPHLEGFYREACGFGPTRAGLLRLN